MKGLNGLMTDGIKNRFALRTVGLRTALGLRIALD